ncbi:MAG TPA: 50S ribosomal protein L10 [Nitrososphaeraceae archaeon]|nr:50S ribosomal protein L10 [Nitrososphaeraceae archaeon]
MRGVPVAMERTRIEQQKQYPKKKRLMYKELQELPRNYTVIALSRLTKVRATQLMTIRKKFQNDIKIRIIKNKVAQRAFEKVKDVAGLENLSKELEGQCALMFTNISPFKLTSFLDQNKVFLPAKGGDVATKDIIIPAGNTGLTPGPVLSEFKEVNVPTKIEQGTIWVNKDTIVARRTDVISQRLASLMSKLNLKPIEAGIAISMAISEGLLFNQKELKIDFGEYQNQLVRCFQDALAVAVEAGYLTTESVKPSLVRAQMNANRLATEAAYLSPSTIEFVLLRAQTKCYIVANEVKKKGYTPQ